MNQLSSEYATALDRIRELEAALREKTSQLKAEQDAHAAVIRKLSAAMGDYTGSWMDAAIERIACFADMRRECDHMELASRQAEADAETLRREVHRLRGDVHGAGLAGELAGEAKERARCLRVIDNVSDCSVKSVQTALSNVRRVVESGESVNRGEHESEASDEGQ